MPVRHTRPPAAVLPPGAPPAALPPPPAATAPWAQAAPGPPGRPEDTPWLRLHPLTPLLRGGRALTVVAVLVYQQLLREAGVRGGAVVLTAALPVALVYGWVSWRRTRYRLSGGDLQVETGVLARRSRRVPLARLQAVDLVRGPVARLVGLAELRLEVVGGGRSEAPLAYLTTADARALRARLLALADPARAASRADGADETGVAGLGDGTPAGRGPALPSPAAPRPLLAVPAGRLVAASLLTGPALVAGVLLVASGVTLAVEGGARPAVTAALVPGLLGSAGVLARRVATEWGFTVVGAPDGLRLRHGLVETRTQSIPLGRVQGVRIVEPVLWRPLDWVRVEVDVAGYGAGGEEEQRRTRALVPVGTRGEAERVVAVALPGAVPALAAPGAPTEGGSGRPPRRALLVAPLAWRRLGVRLGAQVTATTSGVLQRVTEVVPHAKVQSLRLVQGPGQRRLGLASLHVDTAGRYVAGRAPHRDAGEAAALLAALVEAAAAARAPAARAPAEDADDAAGDADDAAGDAGDAGDAAEAPPR